MSVMSVMSALPRKNMSAPREDEIIGISALFDRKVLKLILERGRDRIQITDDMIEEAARNLAGKQCWSCFPCACVSLLAII